MHFSKLAWTFFSTLSIFSFIHEEDDAENDVLRSVVLLTKKVEKIRIKSKKQKTVSDFFK